MSEGYSVVLAGHGSRDTNSIKEFHELARKMESLMGPQRKFSYGFLEFAEPDIMSAVRSQIEAGARTVVVVPALLASATHAKNDMPSQLSRLRLEFPNREIHFAACLDLHPLILKVCRERVIECESASESLVRREDTCLVVVGRGTTDPDANSDVSKLARMLEEGMGFGASFVCYSGTARPLVQDGLLKAAKLGFKRIIVLPYMLFDGVLVKRIYAAANSLAKRFPELEVIKAGYLGPELDVARVFLERAEEGLHGRAHMNCSMCKYRIQIVGYEAEEGLPQVEHQALNQLTSISNRLYDRSAPGRAPLEPYVPHSIEIESMRRIEDGYDWSAYPENIHSVLMRLVHTAGDFSIVPDIFISMGACEAGMRSLLRCRRITTDVTMVESGLKRSILGSLGIKTWCGVHDPESYLLSEKEKITRSAAGIRRAFQKFGNDQILAIGDAPTAVFETLRLIEEANWRPQLVVALPVGFVGTVESKQALVNCINVPRITNIGTRGGSNWAAAVLNSLLIDALALACEQESQADSLKGLALR